MPFKCETVWLLHTCWVQRVSLSPVFLWATASVRHAPLKKVNTAVLRWHCSCSVANSFLRFQFCKVNNFFLMRLLQISTKPVVGKFYFIFVVWFSFSFFNLFLILSWASLGNLKWVDGNCTLPLAFRKEVSRVMPQSPHKPGNQKRGLEHGERTETPYFCHSLPHPPQVLAGLGDRGWDCLPSSREAPLSLSLSRRLLVFHRTLYLLKLLR